jgi:hypothetical protein
MQGESPLVRAKDLLLRSKLVISIGEMQSDRIWGVAKLVKAADFDSAIRGFESFLPSHFFNQP